MSTAPSDLLLSRRARPPIELQRLATLQYQDVIAQLLLVTVLVPLRVLKYVGSFTAGVVPSVHITFFSALDARRAEYESSQVFRLKRERVIGDRTTKGAKSVCLFALPAHTPHARHR